ncbi:hypothetical protein PM082_010136 [Marasmius tenuissimus]|nr:hypothetical protein PM082_010136 [Marasmius tenuissimus]
MAKKRVPLKRVLIFLDSLDVVHIFDSLRAGKPVLNAPFLAIASVLITMGLNLRTRHLPGKENIVADLFSRLLLNKYHACFPANSVGYFTPPRGLIPAPW